jgi:hypothetical protein
VGFEVRHHLPLLAVFVLAGCGAMPRPAPTPTPVGPEVPYTVLSTEISSYAPGVVNAATSLRNLQSQLQCNGTNCFPGIADAPGNLYVLIQPAPIQCRSGKLEKAILESGAVTLRIDAHNPNSFCPPGVYIFRRTLLAFRLADLPKQRLAVRAKFLLDASFSADDQKRYDDYAGHGASVDLSSGG